MSQHTPQESEQTAAKEQDIDQESVLSNIDFNTDLNHNLNLSEYCISSDADTEKMDSNEETSLASLPELRYAPKLASLVKQETPSGSVKRPYQDEVYEQQEDTKKIKVAEKEETGVAGGKEKSVDLRDEQGDEGDNEEENIEEEIDNDHEHTAPPATATATATSSVAVAVARDAHHPIEAEEQRMTALKEITNIEYKFAQLRPEAVRQPAGAAADGAADVSGGVASGAAGVLLQDRRHPRLQAAPGVPAAEVRAGLHQHRDARHRRSSTRTSTRRSPTCAHACSTAPPRRGTTSTRSAATWTS